MWATKQSEYKVLNLCLPLTTFVKWSGYFNVLSLHLQIGENNNTLHHRVALGLNEIKLLGDWHYLAL